MPRINARLVPDAPDVITPGEAMAGMILNGLGCATRPWSSTPPLLARPPRDGFCRAGMHAALGHRLTLGRTLDAASTAGGDRLGQELALALCAHEGLAQRGHHLDTTSLARRGEDVPARAEHAMPIEGAHVAPPGPRPA
jgi:hypothetical protein